MGIFLRFLPVLLAVILVVGAVLVVLNGACLGLTDNAAGATENVAGALAGAMIGAAGIFIGSSLDKLSVWWNARADLEDRSQKIRTLVTVELANVASGLIATNAHLQNCISAGAALPLSDLRAHRPLPMPLTEGLGVELLNLSLKQVDVVSTLLCNIRRTGQNVGDLIELNRDLHPLQTVTLKNAVSSDMEILSQVFEQIAPNRRLSLQGQAPQLAVTLLREQAAR
jgi:hypothetical protein